MSDGAYDPFCDGQKRHESRLRLRLPVKLIARAGEARAVLTNLSDCGARVEKPELPQMQGEVLLAWGRFEAFGVIAWSREGALGVRFYDPIPHEWVMKSRSMDDRDHLPDNSALARLEARNWVAGLNRR